MTKPRAGGLGPTRISTLLGVGAVVTLVSWLLVSQNYDSIPPLSFVILITPGVLAIVLAMLARTTRDRVAQRKSAASLPPIEPTTVARYAALAKASAVAGAGSVGVWLGFLLSVLGEVERLQVARTDAIVSALGILMSLAFVGAALWLEHACRVPPPTSQDTPGARRA